MIIHPDTELFSSKRTSEFFRKSSFIWHRK